MHLLEAEFLCLRGRRERQVGSDPAKVCIDRIAGGVGAVEVAIIEIVHRIARHLVVVAVLCLTAEGHLPEFIFPSPPEITCCGVKVLRVLMPDRESIDCLENTFRAGRIVGVGVRLCESLHAKILAIIHTGAAKIPVLKTYGRIVSHAIGVDIAPACDAILDPPWVMISGPLAAYAAVAATKATKKDAVLMRIFIIKISPV